MPEKTPADVHEYLQQVGADFEILSQQERLLTLRDYGDNVEPLDPALKNEDNYVPGCASATYMICTLDDEGRLHFHGDSESFISKGYIHILTTALSGLTPQMIATEVEPAVNAFADQAGVKMSMIASRANVFERIFHFMQVKAVEAAAKK